MARLTNYLILVFLVFFLFAMQSFTGCSDDDDDTEPTHTATTTPTITPTPSPTGNAPVLLYPINNEQLFGQMITFDWTDAIGATRYWFRISFKVSDNSDGTWVPLWDSTYLECADSQLILSRDDIWYYWQENVLGWTPGEYSWAVQGDTSTTWSETGYFTWLE